ncbi:M56 family metallopeptidase [Tellurirhabdus bombi]|uniref:M56 family metallopeptidase n=1 Tax=Tellurirhabdus bombi TaxID=2907205 RepID=UPI001F452CED|nr:M56 family metallopeptidase [Tellurirhabdus bombi]
MNAVDYFLKANLYLVLFYACYWLWLRRHTFFKLNRAYLIGSVLVALLLPLVELSTQTVEQLPMPIGVITLPVTVLAQPTEPTGPDWKIISYGVYGLIAALIFVRLLSRLTGVSRLIARSRRVPREDHVLVLPEKKEVPSFSFFRYLVLNPVDAQEHQNIVCQHEMVHIRQWHSADILFFELVQVVFWLNPVFIFYKQAIRQVHEFLADESANDKNQYATFLVEYAFNAQPDSLANSFFNPSLLKERILMLHSRTTSRWAVGKYLLVIPLATGLLAMTTAREELTNLVTSVADEKVTVTGTVFNQDKKPLAGATIIVKGTTTGASTNKQGTYQLKNIAANAELVVSFVGYDSQVKAVAGKTSVDFTLAQRPEVLSEIVVVGFVPEVKPTVPEEKSTAEKSDKVFTVVEQKPEFPGGIEALQQYLARHIRYSAAAARSNIQGTVFVDFIINQNGAVSDIKVQKGIGYGCDEEAVRVVSQMPNWTPGKQNGEPVSVKYTIPVRFMLEGNKKLPAEDLSKGVFAPNQWDDPAPLFIIDGIPQVDRPAPGQINPNNILSIDVLKDASATALYGERGKNGVIQVTTKNASTQQKATAFKNQLKIYTDRKLPATYYVNDQVITREEASEISPNTIERIDVNHQADPSEVRIYTRK